MFSFFFFQQTLEQWNKVFFLSIGIVMSSAIAFIFFGTVKIQAWNFVENENKKEEEEKAKKDKNNQVTRFWNYCEYLNSR